MNRRRIAKLIRVRQELWKRLERMRPPAPWRGADDTVSVLGGDVHEAVSAAGPKGLSVLARHLRETATARYPLTHLAGRDQRCLPDNANIVDDAERILRGDWHVLGYAVHVSAETLDWRAHPLSGARTPARHFSQVSCDTNRLGGDVKFLWEINRHQELVRLGQAYWLTQRPDFANAALSLLDSWLDQNPPSVGINWISCVDVAFRTIAWCWLWQLTSESDAWTERRVGRLIWAVATAAEFIARYDSVHHSPNTHLTGEAIGLVYISEVFPELRKAPRWRRLGIDILTDEAGHQFLADGVHFERSTGYHRYNLEFYYHALAIARSSGEDWGERFVKPLSRGLEASIHLKRPDGTWPVLGDEDGGSCVRLGTHDITDQSELLAAAAKLVGRSELLPYVSAASPSLGWWTLPEDAWHARLPQAAPDAMPRSAAMATAGYFVARDDWSDGAWYALVDAGPHGGEVTGHAHTDLGHVEIAYGRQWITVDPGCGLYNGNPERRNWCRSQSAHGCLVLDGTELATPGTRPFRWVSVAPTPAAEAADESTYWYCRAWYEYPIARGRVIHERQVVLVRGRGIVVCDLLSGAGMHDIVVRWPLSVPLEAVTVGRASTASVHGCLVSWATSAGEPVNATLEPLRRSPKFGEEVDASALVLSQRAVKLPCGIVTVFTSAGATPRMHWADDTIEVRIPVAEDAESNTVRVTCRQTVAPQVDFPVHDKGRATQRRP